MASLTDYARAHGGGEPQIPLHDLREAIIRAAVEMKEARDAVLHGLIQPSRVAEKEKALYRSVERLQRRLEQFEQQQKRR